MGWNHNSDEDKQKKDSKMLTGTLLPLSYVKRQVLNTHTMNTFGTGTECPSYRGVRLIESQIEGVKKGRGQL